MRGRRWESWMDAVLLERYPDARNDRLCAELGVSLRSLERHASMLGVRKSAEYVKAQQEDAVRGSARWLEWMKITGQKVKKSPGGKPFERGHRFDAEVEAKRVKAIRDRAWDERVRLIHGWRRVTKWKMVDDFCAREKK